MDLIKMLQSLLYWVFTFCQIVFSETCRLFTYFMQSGSSNTIKL